MCDALCTVHDYTANTKTSPWVLPEHEKEHKFNTWYVTRHKTRPPLQTAPCRAGGPPPLPKCWLSQQKTNNNHQSILSDRKTRVIRGEHARKSSAKKKAKLNSKFANRVSKQTHSLNSASKSTLSTSHYNRHISCDHLPFKSGPVGTFCPLHYCNPRRPLEGSPFFHS